MKRDKPACPLCRNRDTERVPVWPQAPQGSGAAGYRSCGSCGVVFAPELLRQDALEELHRDQYRGGQEPERLFRLDPERSRARQFSPGFQDAARVLLGRMRAQLEPIPAAIDFLEVGCASGGVLAAARSLGWEPQGVELSPEAAQFGREQHGLEIFVGSLEERAFPAARFDLILLYDLIEHVFDPAQLLNECARVLRPGGVMAIHTLNLASWTARFARDRFYLADTSGGHAVLFTTESLAAFVRSAGLTVERVETRGFRWVQRDAAREHLGWRRPWVRIVENLGHELSKRCHRGHFQLMFVRKPKP